MIRQETFTKTNIDRIVAKYKVDYELAARAVFALGLTEALCKSGAEFIFKGGSSLMLLFETPKRLSTDVDILVPPGYPIEDYLKEAAKFYPFRGIQESIRKTNKTISKKHFKITYSSTNADKDLTVIVDVLFAESHYKNLVRKAVNNDLLLCSGEDYYVKIPSPESILGDKLTAFAPHTIGINFYNSDFSNDKRLEVIKQFFDVSCLFDACKNIEEVRATYFAVAHDEIEYRQLPLATTDCLMDSFNSAMCILSRGKFDEGDLGNYIEGFKRISGHVLGRRIHINNVSIDAAKIMLLSASILKGYDPFAVEIYEQDLLEHPPFNKINFVRKDNILAFSLARKSISLLHDIE